MTPTNGQPANPPKRILVVDDVTHVAEVIREMLLHLGYAAEAVADAPEALRAFAPGKYDLVITDYAMPGLSGLELARQLKQRDAGQLILLITGSAFQLAGRPADRVQVDSILIKPFTSREFETAVTAILQTAPGPA